ncbi:FtsX-like permease family protein, partial [candidate division KSB1 bacterium]
FSFYRVRWDDHNYRTFVMLDENATEEDVEDKIRYIFKKYNPGADNIEFYLEPLTDIHLYSEISTEGSSNIVYIYFLSVLGVFVLIIACINFMNISTARSAYRFKEIGMRKVVGGRRKNIIFQFYNESMLLSLVSLVIALILVYLILPSFSNFTERELSFSSLINPEILVIVLCITFFTGIVAGSYPALYLSSFKPVSALKGSAKSGKRGSLFRRILVVVQFTGSVILIIGTFTIYSQIDFVLGKDLGWNKEHLMYIQLRGNSKQYYEVLREELIKNPKILSVASGMYSPSSFNSSTSGLNWSGKNPELSVNVRYNFVDFDYIDTAEYNIINGRKFSRELGADAATGYIINESLAKIMGVDPVIGHDFNFWGMQGKIIGVIKDFHFRSLRSEIEPMVMMLLSRRESWRSYAILRLNTDDITSTVNFIENTWDTIIPDSPIVNGFVDDQLNSMYMEDRRTANMLNYFAALAVFIGCLGLFGLVSFAAEKRKKEIGVRKTLGASILTIIRLMLKEFNYLIIISNCIAWPVSYVLMQKWLDDFSYRIDMGIDIFLLSGSLIIVIAMLTVSYQSIKAAVSNPVDSLRYE